MGKESKFSQRKSPITAKAFLETLFFSNAQHNPSLSQYSIDFEAHGQRKVSKQAIDKRFNSNTRQLLETVLKNIMAKQISLKQHNEKLKSHFSDIQIMDSTEFKVSKRAAGKFPGYGGVGREAIIQIQYEYQLFSKNVTHMSIGSALDSDYKEGFKNIEQVKPDTLLLRDLAYVGKEYFKLLKSKRLYYISRAKTQWSYYLKQDGKYELLTTLDIIDKLKNQEDKYLDIEVFVGSEKKEPMRLIANLLSKEQQKKRLKRKKENGRKLGKDALEGMGLNLFVTNVEAEKCDADAIFQLYTLRWQIELVFKTWKTVLRIDETHSMNAIRLECTILIKLIWIMLNWSILKMMQTITNQDISFHKLSITLMSRSKMLHAGILQTQDLILQWLLNLTKSVDYLKKEYKNGRNKNQEIIALTLCISK